MQAGQYVLINNICLTENQLCTSYCNVHLKREKKITIIQITNQFTTKWHIDPLRLKISIIFKISINLFAVN